MYYGEGGNIACEVQAAGWYFIALLDELPRALIQACIAAGLSQKELAERLGLKEQQIQRYEATDYATASLARLVKIGRALGLKVRAEAWAEQTSFRDDGLPELGLDVTATQCTDLSGRPHFLIGDHRPLPELLG